MIDKITDFFPYLQVIIRIAYQSVSKKNNFARDTQDGMQYLKIRCSALYLLIVDIKKKGITFGYSSYLKHLAVTRYCKFVSLFVQRKFNIFRKGLNFLMSCNEHHFSYIILLRQIHISSTGSSASMG